MNLGHIKLGYYGRKGLVNFWLG